jgi:hypothetical protein
LVISGDTISSVAPDSDTGSLVSGVELEGGNVFGGWVLEAGEIDSGTRAAVVGGADVTTVGASVVVLGTEVLGGSSERQPAIADSAATAITTLGAARRTAERPSGIVTVEHERFVQCIFIGDRHPVACVPLRANVVPGFTTHYPEWK